MFETITQNESYEIRKVELDSDQSFSYLIRYDKEKDIYYSLTTSHLTGTEYDEFYQVPLSDKPIIEQHGKKTKNTLFDRHNTIKLDYDEFKKLGGTNYDLVGFQMFIDYKGIQRYYERGEQYEWC